MSWTVVVKQPQFIEIIVKAATKAEAEAQVRELYMRNGDTLLRSWENKSDT